jgi:D-3-phosphoglycerate dehydrogenase
VDVIERPKALSFPETSLEEVIDHAYQQIVVHKDDSLEALVVLIANAPTITAGLIDQGVQILREQPDLDAVISVSLHNEYHPQYALQLMPDGLLQSHAKDGTNSVRDSYFPDSLLFVIRPQRVFDAANETSRQNFIVDVRRQKVGALIHEGYGDVDYPWQIPLVEEWLRRRGFTEEHTPYDVPMAKPQVHAQTSPAPVSVSPNAKRRVLITTVPFGEADRAALDLLEADGIEYVINPIGRRLREDELIELIQGFGIVIAGTEPITEKVIASAPHLGLIARVGIGLDNVHLPSARDRGIQVTYTPDAPSAAVAELTIGQMISLLRGLSLADRNMHNGIWHRTMGARLSQVTVGLIGLGRVGRLVARHLSGGFSGVRILANDIAPDLDFGRAHQIEWLEKEQIYREADIISLHLPLTPLTRNLITMREIEMMKKNVLLINTSRGNMINERDLVLSLRAGRIAGAAIDVFEREPYTGELGILENCLLTSHMGSMSQDCRARMEIEATQEAVRFLRGEPLKGIVPESEYLMASAG